jgi:Spy/CpxP family protein refolding chaperone
MENPMRLSQLSLASVLLISLAAPAFAQNSAAPPGATTTMPMHEGQPGGDHRRQIIDGINKIDHAYQHLQAAGGDWGGHREAAMNDLMAAKQELGAALAFENAQMGR